MLAKQTAVDDDPVRMLTGVPAWYFMRDRLSLVVAVVMMMSVIMVMVPIIFRGSDRHVGMAWQMRVLAARPGMNYLTKKLHHQVGGNQSVTAKSPHRLPWKHKTPPYQPLF